MSLIPAFEIGIWNAWIFMAWLLIQNLMVMFNKKLYQRLGQPSESKGGRAQKVLNLFSKVLWLLATVYSIFLPLKLGTNWFIIGLGIFLAGLIVNIIALANFASAIMNEPVTKGVYRFSRHPLYAALLLIYLSIGVASASWIFFLITMIWLVLLNISAIDEERLCLKRMGLFIKNIWIRLQDGLESPGKILFL